MSDDPFNGDIVLALRAIAQEFDVDVEALPGGIRGVLRALSAAHYQAGARDATVRLTRAREVGDSERPLTLASESDVTPAYGPFGARRRELSAPPMRFSARPTPLTPPGPLPMRPSLRVTPLVPPPWDDDGLTDDDSQDLH